MGQNAGNRFLNAVVQLTCSKTAAELLPLLHRVERAFNRNRNVHWGPRTLDLDLLAFESQVIDEPALVVPHPALWYRRFVVEPLTEIAPAWRHPTLNETATELLQQLNESCLHLSVAGLSGAEADVLQQRLDAQFSAGRTKITTGKSPNAFAQVQQTTLLASRTQLASPTERVIEIVAATNEGLSLDAWLTAITDILTAALPDGFNRSGTLKQ